LLTDWAHLDAQEALQRAHHGQHAVGALQQPLRPEQPILRLERLHVDERAQLLRELDPLEEEDVADEEVDRVPDEDDVLPVEQPDLVDRIPERRRAEACQA
jgi:hypothetical protein